MNRPDISELAIGRPDIDIPDPAEDVNWDAVTHHTSTAPGRPPLVDPRYPRKYYYSFWAIMGMSVFLLAIVAIDTILGEAGVVPEFTEFYLAASGVIGIHGGIVRLFRVHRATEEDIPERSRRRQ